MKRINTIILCTFSIFFMVSCAKNASPEVIGKPQEPWVNDASLPVPVYIGAGDNYRVESKAAVSAANLEGTQFGIFAVDLDASDAWADGAPQVLLQNKVGRYSSGNIEFVEGKQYYPMLTVYNYTFYGYHTTSTTFEEDPAAFNGSWNGDTFYTDIDLGNTDILWAKAYAEDLTNPSPDSEEDAVIKGFNARYARNARKWYPNSYVQYQPALDFVHLTTALYFRAVAEDDYAAETLAAGNVTVSELSVSGVPTRARLYIADKTGENEGKLNALSGANGTLNMYQGTESRNLGVVPVTAGANIGDGLFLLPQASEGITLNFTIMGPDGATVNRTGLSLPSPANGMFEAGKYYTYNIIIKSLEEITIQASVEDWQNGFTGEGGNTADNIG